MTVTTPYNTAKTLVTVVVILLSMLACGQYVTPTTESVTTVSTTPHSPTLTATVPTETAKPVPVDQSFAVVQAVVNIRSVPAGDVVGYLTTGENVAVLECTDKWCRIEQGWIWRGCISDNPAKLGCSAK